MVQTYGNGSLKIQEKGDLLADCEEESTAN